MQCTFRSIHGISTPFPRVRNEFNSMFLSGKILTVNGATRDISARKGGAL